ncbi:MAG: protein-glutamate O-methyltransferase CheR [Deltaproteobacteria bacterium]|nr:protein-glutamate O-methyltransferase CheR [Deltaproteobacteria bacterium]
MSFISSLPSSNAMTDEEFRLFKTFVYDECGINLKPEKKYFLQNRVNQRMRVTGIKSYYRYYKLITGDGADYKTELLSFLDVLTINETSFYRNKPQLDLFQKVVLPELLHSKRAKNDFSLKIWSAGCSTGQEPYTIAMILNNVMTDIKGWKVNILASDLSLTVLEAAQQGIYPKAKTDGLDEYSLKRYFIEKGDNFHVSDELKRIITFDFHNLMYDNGFSNIDVIFCRNVLIYFDTETQKEVIGRFYQCLAPKGYLFPGHTESLQGVNENFVFIHKDRGTVYQKK